MLNDRVFAIGAWIVLGAMMVAAARQIWFLVIASIFFFIVSCAVKILEDRDQP